MSNINNRPLQAISPTTFIQRPEPVVPKNDSVIIEMVQSFDHVPRALPHSLLMPITLAEDELPTRVSGEDYRKYLNELNRLSPSNYDWKVRTIFIRLNRD